MNATEWIQQRRDLMVEFSQPYQGMAFDHVGMAILAKADLPKALAMVEAALAEHERGHFGPILGFRCRRCVNGAAGYAVPSPWPCATVAAIEAALRGEKPTAWSCTCAAAYHDAPMSFDVAGDTASAIRAARAAGWKPCHEVAPLLSKSMLSWWCPECVARFTAASKINRKEQL